MRSTGSYSDNLTKLRTALLENEAILVGAGAGLSTSAGFEYAGARFRENFAEFEEAYGFHDMYSGGFYPFAAPEEYWAYWSRQIMVNRYADAPKDTYPALLRLMEQKEYFVLTTNVDHCFQKAGFDKQRLFYTQGDYGLFQCALPCHDRTYDNEEPVRRMNAEQSNLRIPSNLIPRCPVCGEPMTMNLRSDERFVQDEGWYAASARYSAFLEQHADGKLLLLELGVGYNTPGIIKYPFWRLAMRNPRVTYACINSGEALCPAGIAGQSILIQADITQALHDVSG